MSKEIERILKKRKKAKIAEKFLPWIHPIITVCFSAIVFADPFSLLGQVRFAGLIYFALVFPLKIVLSLSLAQKWGEE